MTRARKLSERLADAFAAWEATDHCGLPLTYAWGAAKKAGQDAWEAILDASDVVDEPRWLGEEVTAVGVVRARFRVAISMAMSDEAGTDTRPRRKRARGEGR